MVALVLAAGCAGGGAADDTRGAAFSLTSSAFDDGGPLPADLACERDGGDGVSPPVDWDGPPAVTAEFALTMTHYPTGSNPDVDVPNFYWLLWNIPADIRSLARGNPESIGDEGSDKDGVTTGYAPPCSPDDEVHVYTLRLFALSGDPGLGDADDLTVDWAVLTEAIDGLILDEAELGFTD